MENKRFLEKIAFEPELYTKERAYWLEKLAGDLVRTNLPYDYHKAGETSFARVNFKLPKSIASRLLQVANRSDSRLHMLLVGGLVLFMNKCTGNKDIIVGIPIDKQEIEGNFINTVLPLRLQLTEGMVFKELLFKIKTTIIEASEHQNFPVEALPNELNMAGAGNEFPLFDTAILLRNIHDESYLEHIHINVLFSFIRIDGSLEGIVTYNTAFYESETVERVVRHFNDLLEKAFRDVNVKIADIQLLDSEERERIVYGLNGREADYPGDKTIDRLFLEQAEKTPGKTAILDGEKGDSITYEELNRRVDRVVELLWSRGVRRGTVVPVMGQRKIGIIAGILGILRAGGVYLPIDAKNPQDRIMYIIRDSRAQFILTQGHLLETHKDTLRELPPGNIIDIDNPGLSARGTVERFEKDRHPRDPAYIIYTSGTTGSPKGVMVHHRALVNYVTWAARQYVRENTADFPLYTSISFDLTVTSIFTPLITGNTIVLYSGDDKQVLIEKIVDDNKVGIIKLTPSHLYMLKYKTILQSRIKRLVVGGEELHRRLARDIHTNFNGEIEIYNEYGPTEGTVGCMIHRFDPDADNRDMVPIGVPADNARIYVLDENREALPVGIIGELYISGDGVAKGYVNRPELTAEKFVPNPFVAGERVYRSGDLARRLPNDLLEFVGRKDKQVKIRGHRIELAEIEHRLQEESDIKEAVVGVKTGSDGVKNLAAYFTADKEIEPAELRNNLTERLPEYMIPAYFVQLEQIPRTVGGKIDHKNLPDPTGKIKSGANYEPPKDETQERMVDVWEEVLGVKGIGINDNFFSIGGDSIKCIQISARLMKYNLKVNVSDLFLNQTINQLSPYVQVLEEAVDQGPVEGNVELVPIQEWFFESNFAHPHHYNHALMLYRETGFDRHILQTVFTAVVVHHDALRAVYETVGNRVVQRNRGIDGKLFDLEIINLEGEEEDISGMVEKEANRIQAGIDLTGGPLVKLGLFKTSRGDHLLIVIHHLVVDGLSWWILLEDIDSGYRAALSGEPVQFMEKTHSFKYWAEKLRQYAQSDAALAELDYWRNIEETPVDTMVKDKEISREERTSSRGESLGLALNERDTERLLKEVNRAYNTEINDILLTALALALKEWSGTKRAAVNLEAHGREDIIETMDINRTVGWFTSQFPILLDVGEDRGLGYHIKHIKDTLRRIPNKGIGYGILRYLTPPEKKENIVFAMQPEISFNYFGQFLGEKQEGMFSISTLKPGGSVSPACQRLHALDISGILTAGQLRLSLGFDGQEFRMERMEALAEIYRTKLEEIIEHCSTREGEELTPGDLSYSELEIEELDELKNLVNEID